MRRKHVSSNKWYVAGLRFGCTQCGNCCSGPPGYVWVTKDEAAEIAKAIGRKDGRLGKEHLRRVGFKHSLTEKPDGDCVFLVRDGKKALCGIYAVRPLQCRTWPFWSSNLRSQNAWEESTADCPGVNRGKHHDLPAIEAQRLKKSW